jgi:hypothetical protein
LPRSRRSSTRAMGDSALSAELRERIARNRAAAEQILRKRKLEDECPAGDVGHGVAAKRLSSVVTPQQQEHSPGVAKALAALKRKSEQDEQQRPQQHVAAEHGVHCAGLNERCAGLPSCAAREEPPSWPDQCSWIDHQSPQAPQQGRPSVESWLESQNPRGQADWEESSGSGGRGAWGQQGGSGKQQSFLSFGRGAQLSFGRKPEADGGHAPSSKMPEALKRSENVDKYLSAKGEKLRALPTWANEAATTLTEEQLEVKERVMANSNVFLTGGAGTGKSFLVKDMIKCLKRKFGARAVGITATTAIAASPLGGTSLHSYTGIGLGQGTAHELADKIKKIRATKQRWAETKVLIIDEVSMLSPELLEKLEEIARIIKNNQRPFGGIQLLFVGDFLQLPPVTDRGKPLAFAFESRIWNTVVDLHFELQIVHRQENHSFVKVLNDLRRGICNPDTTAILRATCKNMLDESDVVATKLYAKNIDVDNINSSCLSKISKPAIVFTAEDSGSSDYMVNQLDKFVLAPKALTLKEGAQVMLLKNLDQDHGLVFRVSFA